MLLGTDELILRKVALALLILCGFFAWVVRCRVRALRLRQRWKAGQCLSCGYDLRESPERCPECGPLRREQTDPSLDPFNRVWED